MYPEPCGFGHIWFNIWCCHTPPVLFVLHYSVTWEQNLDICKLMWILLILVAVLWYPVSVYHNQGQRPTPLLEFVCFKNAGSSSYFSQIILKFLLCECEFCKQVLELIGYNRNMLCARFLTLIDGQRNILINGGCHPPPPLYLMVFQWCVLCVFFRQWSWQAPVLSFLMNTTPCLSVNQNLFSIREKT